MSGKLAGVVGGVAAHLLRGSARHSHSLPAVAPPLLQSHVGLDTTYRRDIDGLRAIAILSVLGFHAAPRLAPSGFTGVDVFFVISGYLITGIILQGLACDGFSFTEFYARRIRRIFPALIVVLVSVLCCGWLKLFPGEYTGLAKHVAGGSAYVSNFLLNGESGYFDTAAALKPLLHLWSLGIEEQFYIFWPVLLVLTWKYRAQWLLMVAIACASFVLNVARLDSHPAATFYLLPTRLWELALGGILARAQIPGTTLPGPFIRLLHFGGAFVRPTTEATRRRAAAALGLGLLTVSIGALDSHGLFPGWRAVAPTVGTLLLIAAGTDTWINRHVLGNQPMVFIGQISYPLYLWHWPLLSFTRIIHGGDLTTIEALTALAAAFILAVLTHRCIELPVRSVRPATRAAVPLFVCASIVGICGYVIFVQRVNPLSARYGVEPILRGEAEMAFPGPNLKELDTAPSPLLMQRAGALRVLFIGDSNMEQYYPRVNRLLTSDPVHYRTAVFATGGGCPPIPGVYEAHHRYCDGLVARATAYANDPSVDSVVIGAAWQSYFAQPDERYSYYFREPGFTGGLAPGSQGARRALSSLDAMISGFIARGKKVFIILQIPVGDALEPRGMIVRSLWKAGFQIHVPPLRRAEVLAAIAPIDSKLIDIAHRNGAAVIDPLAELCGETLCPTIEADGVPVYRDGSHLRPSYVRDRVSYLDDILVIPDPSAPSVVGKSHVFCQRPSPMSAEIASCNFSQ